MYGLPPDTNSTSIPSEATRRRQRDAVPPDRCPGNMNRLHHRVLEAVVPFAQVRYPDMEAGRLIAACHALTVAMTSRDWPHLLQLFDLYVRFGRQLSVFEIRESVRRLGTQADLMLFAWVTGHHTERTGIVDFGIALWDYEVNFALTDDAARKVRGHFDLPTPPDAMPAARRPGRDKRHGESQAPAGSSVVDMSRRGRSRR